jgi:hypothetical protein
MATGLSTLGIAGVLSPPVRDVGAGQSNRWFGVGITLAGAVAWLFLARRAYHRMMHPASP